MNVLEIYLLGKQEPATDEYTIPREQFWPQLPSIGNGKFGGQTHLPSEQ
jgi:hypothetical protein